MGRFECSVAPSIDNPLVQQNVTKSNDAPAHVQADDPLASARGVVWALIFGALFWVGPYMLWRLMFR